MKALSRLVALVLVGLLLTPQADALMSMTMPRKAVLEPGILLLAGFWVARPVAGECPPVAAPAAVAAATLFAAFWMIPRSIDLTQIFVGARVLYVLSLFTAGFLLSAGLPLLPKIASTAYLLYMSSMIAAVGMLYSSQNTLWCSAYTIEDQHRFGTIFTIVGLAGYIIVLIGLPRWLASRHSQGGPVGQVT